jgi:hypothetical protein
MYVFLLYSNEQTCRTLWHYWTLQHRKVILHGHVVEYGTKTIAMSEGSRVHVKVPCFSAAHPAKVVPPFSSSNTWQSTLLQTVNCRKVWGKQLTGTQQGSPHCLVWNSHKCPSNTATKTKKYKWETKYGCMQRHLPTTNLVKAALPLSSSNNQLHSCRLSIAEKCGANNWQEQSKAPLTVQYEIHTSAQPIQQPNQRSTSEKQSMGECKGAFLPTILWKQRRP